MEIWKDIEDYEGLYQVSELGNLKSLLFNKQKLLNPILNNQGYYQVNLKGTKFLVHRLVAQAFIPNPNQYTVINHKDSNPKNNTVENLEWCTQSYNCRYSTKHNGSQNSNASIDEETAALIFKMFPTKSTTQIAGELNIVRQVVYNVINGRTWTHVTGLPRKRYYSVKRALKTAA